MSVGLKSVDRPAECEMFARAYLIERDPVRAYLLMHPRAKFGTACIEGPRLLARPEVRALLALAGCPVGRVRPSGAESAGNAEATVTGPGLELRTVSLACRHCHGIDHRHQRTREEMDEDRRAHEREVAKWTAIFRRAKKVMPDRHFDTQGGDGFDPARPPDPGCPNCKGHGVPRLVAVDRSTGDVKLITFVGGSKRSAPKGNLWMRAKP